MVLLHHAICLSALLHVTWERWLCAPRSQERRGRPAYLRQCLLHVTVLGLEAGMIPLQL